MAFTRRSARGLRLVLEGAALLAVAVAAPAARAQTAPAAPAQAPAATPARPVDAEVERHAALGQRLLERGDTQDAIAEFRRAYELRADPRFLYDIAEGYRRLGLAEQARFFYQRYLAAAPDAPDRDEVEAALAALDHAAAPPKAAPTPPATNNLARDVVIVPVAPRAEPSPLWRRWWVWTAFGAIVAGSIATVLLTRQSDTAVPATALGDKRFYP
jgi:tetratricopeptide (TPR) repeat protein